MAFTILYRQRFLFVVISDLEISRELGNNQLESS